MEKTEYLNKVQYYKNAIDMYSGSDPLKVRYEYIMWLENNVGKENSDVIICLEQTLQRFQDDSRYTNDARFVELLILFARLKGDKLSYFKKLYECKLGTKCSILYKAWSDECLIYHKFLDAYNVLKKGIHDGAQPLDLLVKSQREIENFIGKKILLGSASCEMLMIPCSCYKHEEKKEVLEVKSWEMNPLKPGQPDNFTCPLYIADPDDPNKLPMYAKYLVYCGSGENQWEEVQARRYYQRVESKKNCAPANTGNPPISPVSNVNHQLNDVSIVGQSFTAHTKVALDVMREMWDSPAPSDDFKPKASFKVPEVPKPITVYNDSISQEPENAGVANNSRARGASTGPKLQKGRLSMQPFGEILGSGGERGAAKHQLMFGGAPAIEDQVGEDLATCLDPNSCSVLSNRPQIPNDWNVEDLTCNTKVFNNFLSIYSTPNMKGKETINTPQSSSNGVTSTAIHQKSDAGILSVILEASKETPSSSSSGNDQRPPSILDVERSFENLDINTNDPFCPKLLEILLKKVNYPHNLNPPDLLEYHVINNKLPNITKTLKLGDFVYTLTGETFKGAYAKVMKVSYNDKLYALKIEKPACHWEYYICKEIRKRLNPENLRYFSDISKAFFFQNGSMFLSDYAKYGNLLNVINQYKKSSAKTDTAGLFFCIEVISAVNYLNTQCNIIHGDIKPDNFVVHSLPTSNPPGLFVQLIDFGRAIDMRLMPKGCEFNYVVTTDGFQCNEMKENRPWTYQTDLYGLAGTLYCILVGNYMKVVKKDDTYVLSSQLPRMHQALWNPIFNTLLNIESSNALPDLTVIQRTLKEVYNDNDTFTIRSAFSTLINILNGN